MRLLTMIFLAALIVSTAHAQTAEQKFKNIQIFKTLPATQLDPTMAFISGSLGVRCNYCHVSNGFDKDDKQTKLTARRMIQMVFDLNKRSFIGQDAVTCYTCHRGKPIRFQFLRWARISGRRVHRHQHPKRRQQSNKSSIGTCRPLVVQRR